MPKFVRQLMTRVTILGLTAGGSLAAAHDGADAAAGPLTVALHQWLHSEWAASLVLPALAGLTAIGLVWAAAVHRKQE